MKTHWRQKLTNEQIATIFYLYGQGYSKAVIARTVKQSCNVALSTTYYHLDQVELAERMAKKTQIIQLIQAGMNTMQIALLWNVPLDEINQIYAGKRLN